MIVLFGSVNDFDISFLKVLFSYVYVMYGLCKVYFYLGSEILISLNMCKSKFECNMIEMFLMFVICRCMYNGCLIKKSFKRYE